jgi:hypothetical protein
MAHLILSAGYKSRIRNFKPTDFVLRRHNVLYFLDNAIVVLSARRLLAPHHVGQTARTSSVAIEPMAYAATQKKGLGWAKKRLSYVDARRRHTLGPASISWLIPPRLQSRSTPIGVCTIQRRARM